MKKEEVNKQIKEVVRPNGKGEINGNNLQETLLLMNNNAANDEDTTSKLNLKANQKETDEKLALKADKTSVYTKEEANALLDLKVNIKDYEADKEVSSKEKQELDIKLTQTKQELDSVKNSLSHMGNGVVGEAKGGSIISLPENAMKSVVPNYKIEGLTLTNLHKNEKAHYRPVDGSTNYDYNGGVFSYEMAEGSWTALFSKDLFNLKEGDKYFIMSAFKYPKDGVRINLGFAKNEWGVGDIFITVDAAVTTKMNDYVTASSIIDITKSGSGFLRFRVNGAIESEQVYIKPIACINLTQMFGAGNEPSKEWCDANLPDYVEGTKSVQLPMRIKGVGANQVGYTHHIGTNGIDIRLQQDVVEGINTISYVTGPTTKDPLYKVNLLKGRVYYNIDAISPIKEDRFSLRVIFDDGSTETIIDTENTPLGNEWVNFKGYFDSPKAIVGVKGKYNGSTRVHIRLDTMYIGNSPKISPYQESLAYFNDEVELSSLATTKDYIENGKLYKNVKRYYFSKEDKWTLREDYTGDNFRYYMAFPFNYKATGAGVEGELFCNNFTPTSNVPSVLTERDSNTIALYRENASTLYLTLDKKVSDVNSIIPEGTFIDVILPQTEVVNLNTSGLIEANPNGTVFFEPITNLTGFYDNGLDVEGLDILEIEEFSHLINGVYQRLDVSKVKVEGGKLTHPDAQNGIVYLVYRYDDNAVWGENTISYYNSDKTLKSPNGKIWKKVESATDTGELVVTLEEIVEPLKEEEK